MRVEPTERELPDIPDVAQNDLGYFMSLAGRYELLGAEDERRLGHQLWDGRRRMLRILRAARSTTPSRVSLDLEARQRAITAPSRRRMAKVEQYARSLVDRREPLGAPGARRHRAATAKLERALRETVAEMDEARRVLAESNLRLVVWVAKGFRGRGFDFIDLIQEGSVGLLRAIDRFDPMVGARFSTFATHWIQQGIRRALAEKARTIRIPVNRIPEVRQTLMARAQLAEELGRPARPEELAAAVGLPKHKLEELLPAIAPIESIDAPIASTERALGDTLEDRDHKTPLQTAMEEETRRAVAAVLDELPDRQRQIPVDAARDRLPAGVHPRGDRRGDGAVARAYPAGREGGGVEREGVAPQEPSAARRPGLAHANLAALFRSGGGTRRRDWAGAARAP